MHYFSGVSEESPLKVAHCVIHRPETSLYSLGYPGCTPAPAKSPCTAHAHQEAATAAGTLALGERIHAGVASIGQVIQRAPGSQQCCLRRSAQAAAPALPRIVRIMGARGAFPSQPHIRFVYIK